MLMRDRIILTLGLVTAAALGCSDGNTAGTGGGGGTSTRSTGDATTSATTTTGSTTGATTTSTSGAGGGGCMSATGTVLAIKNLYFGEGNAAQWKKFGFDIDGKTSTATSKDLCMPVMGGQ